VKVTNVNTLNRKGKSTRNRRTGVVGMKPNTKRAIVTLRAVTRSPLRELRTAMAHVNANPRAPVAASRRLGLRRHHEDAAREVAARFQAKTGGRNNYGRKTSRHRGGGHKQQYRIIDFRRNKDAIPARVAP